MLSNYMLSVPCCDFCIKTCLISLFSCLFCRWFMFYICYLYLFMYTGVQHDFHIRWCLCRLTVIWLVSHVEQELLTLLEHLNSSPVFSGVHVTRSLVFYVMFCRSLFFLLVIVLSVLLLVIVLSVLLLLVIVLSVLLRFTLLIASLVSSKFSRYPWIVNKEL